MSKTAQSSDLSGCSHSLTVHDTHSVTVIVRIMTCWRMLISGFKCVCHFNVWQMICFCHPSDLMGECEWKGVCGASASATFFLLEEIGWWRVTHEFAPWSILLYWVKFSTKIRYLHHLHLWIISERNDFCFGSCYSYQKFCLTYLIKRWPLLWFSYQKFCLITWLWL